MGDASEEWQAVGTVAVGDVVGSYDPVTRQWMCGRYDATHAGGVQPTVKTDHADHAVAQRWSMPMQQHMHGHGPLMTAPMLSMSSTPSLPPMPSMPPVHSRPNVPSTMRRTPWAQASPMPPTPPILPRAHACAPGTVCPVQLVLQRRTRRSRARASLSRFRSDREEELKDHKTDTKGTLGSRRGRQTSRADSDLKPSAGGKQGTASFDCLPGKRTSTGVRIRQAPASNRRSRSATPRVPRRGRGRKEG